MALAENGSMIVRRFSLGVYFLCFSILQGSPTVSASRSASPSRESSSRVRERSRRRSALRPMPFAGLSTKATSSRLAAQFYTLEMSAKARFAA
jgi:hypothetical protein